MGQDLSTDEASTCYLRQRIMAGDLSALSSPSLPRLLEIECQEAWWHQGLRACTGAILASYLGALSSEETSQAVSAWGAAMAPEVTRNRHWTQFLQRLCADDEVSARIRRVQGLVDHLWAQAPSARTWGASAIFRLLRQLRGLLAEAPVEVDAALLVLIRYGR